MDADPVLASLDDSRRAQDDRQRHDNPHWPVRSRHDAVAAIHQHRECADKRGEQIACATFVAAVIVTRNDFEFFRDRGR